MVSDKVACPRCQRPGVLNRLPALSTIGKRFVAYVHHPVIMGYPVATMCQIQRHELERLVSDVLSNTLKEDK